MHLFLTYETVVKLCARCSSPYKRLDVLFWDTDVDILPPGPVSKSFLKSLHGALNRGDGVQCSMPE